MKRIVNYKHIAFMFLSTSVFKNNLNVWTYSLLLFFVVSEKKNVYRWLIYSHEAMIYCSTHFVTWQPSPQDMNRNLTRSLVHGTTQTLCILKKRKSTEIETKVEYSYSLTVALNNIFFLKSTSFFPQWNGLWNNKSDKQTNNKHKTNSK